LHKQVKGELGYFKLWNMEKTRNAMD